MRACLIFPILRMKMDTRSLYKRRGRLFLPSMPYSNHFYSAVSKATSRIFYLRNANTYCMHHLHPSRKSCIARSRMVRFESTWKKRCLSDWAQIESRVLMVFQRASNGNDKWTSRILSQRKISSRSLIQFHQGSHRQGEEGSSPDLTPKSVMRSTSRRLRKAAKARRSTRWNKKRRND